MEKFEFEGRIVTEKDKKEKYFTIIIMIAIALGTIAITIITHFYWSVFIAGIILLLLYIDLKNCGEQVFCHLDQKGLHVSSKSESFIIPIDEIDKFEVTYDDGRDLLGRSGPGGLFHERIAYAKDTRINTSKGSIVITPIPSIFDDDSAIVNFMTDFYKEIDRLRKL